MTNPEPPVGARCVQSVQSNKKKILCCTMQRAGLSLPAVVMRANKERGREGKRGMCLKRQAAEQMGIGQCEGCSMKKQWHCTEAALGRLGHRGNRGQHTERRGGLRERKGPPQAGRQAGRQRSIFFRTVMVHMQARPGAGAARSPGGTTLHAGAYGNRATNQGQEIGAMPGWKWAAGSLPEGRRWARLRKGVGRWVSDCRVASPRAAAGARQGSCQRGIHCGASCVAAAAAQQLCWQHCIPVHALMGETHCRGCYASGGGRRLACVWQAGHGCRQPGRSYRIALRRGLTVVDMLLLLVVVVVLLLVLRLLRLPLLRLLAVN